MQDPQLDPDTVGNGDESEFDEDDVFFECPRCGHSMAISNDGIGMVVSCTECGLDVIVPSPGEDAESAGTESSGDESEAKAPRKPEDDGYHVSRTQRDMIFDEIASIQRSLDRLVADLDSLN